MKTTRKHLLTSLGLVAALGLGAYWYWSPYVALYEMRNAARDADGDAFNAHVDYPKLRESLKGELSAMLTRDLMGRSGTGSDTERAAAGMGNMLGLAMMDKIVDMIVTPEAVMGAMQKGQFKLDDKPAHGNVEGAAGPAGAPRENADNSQWHSERKNANLLIVYAGRAGEKPAAEQAGFVMAREGFAHWRLTGIRLPASGK